MTPTIESLGERQYLSPLRHMGSGLAKFKADSDRILCDDRSSDNLKISGASASPRTFEIAGPRERIYFAPEKTVAAILTCGGLSPGLNDVVRGIVMELWHGYHVVQILGIRYGFEGLVSKNGHSPLKLNPERVSNIHSFGGTILGTSRGAQEIDAMVDGLQELGVDILFVIGGDGTLKAASAIAEEIQRRSLRKSVIGIPKTIDNDIEYLDKSFGFETAFAKAVEAVSCAHVEAISAYNGIGLVKLMGRESGFIACYATLASQQVNFCLVPEVAFALEGSGAFLEVLRHRIALRKHAVVVVAEGAGQNFLTTDSAATDASGNKRLGDIGIFLRDKITQFFKSRNTSIALKYIDPSYAIRSVPASAQDNVYCSILAQNAVHAGMAGKTKMLVGRWHDSFVHIPMGLVIQSRHKIDPEGDIWRFVLEATGQPARML
jgi:6-phosphofructokinase 1